MQLSVVFDNIIDYNNNFRLSVESSNEQNENISNVQVENECCCYNYDFNDEEDSFEAINHKMIGNQENQYAQDKNEASNLMSTMANSGLLAEKEIDVPIFSVKGGFTSQRLTEKQDFSDILDTLQSLNNEVRAHETFSAYKERTLSQSCQLCDIEAYKIDFQGIDDLSATPEQHQCAQAQNDLEISGTSICIEQNYQNDQNKENELEMQLEVPEMATPATPAKTNRKKVVLATVFTFFITFLAFGVAILLKSSEMKENFFKHFSPAARKAKEAAEAAQKAQEVAAQLQKQAADTNKPVKNSKKTKK